MVSIEVEGSRLLVRTPFTLKESCKAVPGARWDKLRRAWSYPATIHSARNLDATFQQDMPVWSTEAKALLTDGAVIDHAAAHKTTDDLPPIPKTKLTPWLHQLRAYHVAKSLPACLLALDMGTGKTKVAIDLIINEGWPLTVILCPRSVVAVWPGEFLKHAAVDVAVLCLLDGTVTVRSAQVLKAWALQCALKKPLVVVLNYDAAWRAPMDTTLLGLPVVAVILDESHRIKSPSGRASLFCARLGEHARKRICLTGTPMPHSPLDIYGQMRFLDKGVFGTSFSLFRARYAIMGGYGNHQVFGYQREEELRQKMYALTYRVKADEVQNLPETLDIVKPCLLSPKGRALYDQLKRDFTISLEAGEVTTTNALTRLLRLQQITSGHLHTDDGAYEVVDTAKKEALFDLLEGLPSDEPVIIFTRFTHDLRVVHEVCADLKRHSLELSGRVNGLAPWQQGAAPILGVQIQSGGVGVDLTRACHVVYYSLGYSLGDYEQSRKRVHRPGQARTVRYYHLVAEGTVDHDVYRALEQRQNVIETLLTHWKDAA